jgi:hypothetical protein
LPHLSLSCPFIYFQFPLMRSQFIVDTFRKLIEDLLSFPVPSRSRSQCMWRRFVAVVAILVAVAFPFIAPFRWRCSSNKCVAFCVPIEARRLLCTHVARWRSASQSPSCLLVVVGGYCVVDHNRTEACTEVFNQVAEDAMNGTAFHERMLEMIDAELAAVGYIMPLARRKHLARILRRLDRVRTREASRTSRAAGNEDGRTTSDGSEPTMPVPTAWFATVDCA